MSSNQYLEERAARIARNRALLAKLEVQPLVSERGSVLIRHRSLACSVALLLWFAAFNIAG